METTTRQPTTQNQPENREETKARQEQEQPQRTDYTKSKTTKLVIEIPALPPKECSPNWRGYWMEKYRAARDYKDMTILMARTARGRPRQPHPAITITPTLVVPHQRYVMDPDNAIASLKPAIDGLQIAGIIANDKDATVLPVTYRIDATTEPKTILSIEATPPRHTTQRGQR